MTAGSKRMSLSIRKMGSPGLQSANINDQALLVVLKSSLRIKRNSKWGKVVVKVLRIISPQNPSTTVNLQIPRSPRMRTARTRILSTPTFKRHFGRLSVSGRRRVAWPAARITARTKQLHQQPCRFVHMARHFGRLPAGVHFLHQCPG